MLERTRGVVLHQLKYGEDSLIVDIYTQGHGTLSFMVKVPRSRKSSLRTMLLRPLNILELDFDYLPSRNLHRVTELRLAVPYTSLPYDPMKETLALYLSEFLYHALRHEGQNEALFQYLCTAMQWLDGMERGLANFHLVFLIRMTRFLGIWPDVGRNTSGLVFDIKDAVLTSTPPLHRAYLDAVETSFLPLLLRVSFGNMHLLRLNRQQRARILEVLELYYKIHVPEFQESKSLSVLKEMFT